MSLFACCLLLTAILLAVSATESGLTELQNRGNACSEQVLRYTCVTGGSGATEVTLDNATLPGLEFSHARYADGSNVNQSSLGGNVTAGNLSQSRTKECFDELANRSASFCYQTVIQVHLTEQTRCRAIGCRTRFRISGEDKLVDFGSATLTRVPLAPKNLRNMTLSAEAVIITWDPGSVSCSEANYSVSTSNCGSCDNRSINTAYMNITCEEVDPGQQCHVSVRSVLECGALSDAATLTFEVISPKSTTEATTDVDAIRDVRAIVGGVVGGVAAIIIGIIITIVVVITAVKLTRRIKDSVDFQDTKRSDVKGEKEDTKSDEGDKQIRQDEEVCVPYLDSPKVDNKVNESTTEDVTVDIEADRRLLSSPSKDGQSVAIATATEVVPLCQLSSSNSTKGTAADSDQKPLIEAENDLQSDGDTKTYAPQSSEESRAEVAEESNADVISKPDKLVAVSIPKTDGMQSHHVYVHEATLPSVATNRGMEPVHFGLPPIYGSFSGQVDNEREFDETREKTVIGTVCNQDASNKSYALSDQGKLLSQAHSTEDKKPTTAVPPSDDKVQSSQTVAGTTQFSNVAPGSSQLTDILKRVHDLETGREEQTQEIKELKTGREEQRKEITDLKTSQEEHTQEIEKSKLKIDNLEAEARKNELKVEQLMERIEQLTKDLEAKEKNHQEEVEKLEQEHLAEKSLLKQEIENSKTELQALRTELENERKQSKTLREKLEQEKRKARNLERMAKVSSSLDKKDSRPELYRIQSCPANQSASHTL